MNLRSLNTTSAFLFLKHIKFQQKVVTTALAEFGLYANVESVVPEVKKIRFRTLAFFEKKLI